ncbi:hypothetical protein BDQ17DRAFT_1326060 [Cyathus striatus]|nr:hypothetical protein BDQ17DRAFT_1326060 [Cyathus striatus]
MEDIFRLSPLSFTSVILTLFMQTLLPCFSKVLTSIGEDGSHLQTRQMLSMLILMGNSVTPVLHEKDEERALDDSGYKVNMSSFLVQAHCHFTCKHGASTSLPESPTAKKARIFDSDDLEFLAEAISERVSAAV